jgi:hypothetical protein
MVFLQRFAILWCLSISFIIGVANIDYMSGYGTGSALEIGIFVIPRSYFFGLIAAIIDTGMVLGLFAMARWTHERQDGKWFLACALFLMCSAIATHSLYRSIQSNIGSKQELLERTSDQYEDARKQRDQAAAQLVTLRDKLNAPSSADAVKMRAELTTVQPSERSRIALLERNILAIEAAEKTRLNGIQQQISDAEKRHNTAVKTMGWASVEKKVNPIAGFEAYIAGFFMFADIAGWLAFVGFGAASSAQPPPPRVTVVAAPKRQSQTVTQLPSPPTPPKSGVLVPQLRLAASDGEEVPPEAIRAVQLKNEGQSQAAIGAIIGKSQSTVHKMLKKYEPILAQVKKEAAAV